MMQAVIVLCFSMFDIDLVQVYRSRLFECEAWTEICSLYGSWHPMAL